MLGLCCEAQTTNYGLQIAICTLDDIGLNKITFKKRDGELARVRKDATIRIAENKLFEKSGIEHFFSTWIEDGT